MQVNNKSKKKKIDKSPAVRHEAAISRLKSEIIKLDDNGEKKKIRTCERARRKGSLDMFRYRLNGGMATVV